MFACESMTIAFFSGFISYYVYYESALPVLLGKKLWLDFWINRTCHVYIFFFLFSQCGKSSGSKEGGEKIP